MVAVTVQPRPAAVRAQGGAFVFAVLLNQVIADEDLVVVVAQPFPCL